MSGATETRAVREVIAMAVRTHGRKRGWHEAARLLRVTERWVKAACYGEPFAAPDPIIIAEAAIALARVRAAQLRAELNELERGLNGENLDCTLTMGEPAR